MGRRRKRLRSMHPSSLIDLATKGNADAVDEVIERQQNHMALRYYPNGRSSVIDDGVVMTSIRAANGVVEIRSGRPWSTIRVDKETAFNWIIGIPKHLMSVITEYAANGMDLEESQEQMENAKTKGFVSEIIMHDFDDLLHVNFYPKGHKAWRLDSFESAFFVAALCHACRELGWQYSERASNNELSLIHALLKDIDMSPE